MKSSFLCSLTVYLLICFSGCLDRGTDTVDTTSSGRQLGKVSLSFGAAPQEITQVIARLTRSGFTTLVLNLTVSDSTHASGSFNEVAVGQWHLAVEARDNSNNVRYSGEADVNVVSGQTANVTLQLLPISGQIVITVTWGSTPNGAFEIPLVITDGASVFTAYFGFVPGANLCIAHDTYNGHTEIFLPPIPPGGVFDARIVTPRTAGAAACYDQGSMVDFRPPNFFPAGKDTFKVSSQFGTGTAMVFSWPPGLSARFTSLTLRYFNTLSGQNVDVDMLTNTSADVTTAGTIALVRIFSAIR